MKNLAIFASGGGSNAEKIITYFKDKDTATVKLIFSNKQDAFVCTRAKNHGIPYSIFDKNDFQNEIYFLNILREQKIDFIILAGFLWKIPPYLINAFPKKIINIHPSLLPKYGGKGMYGKHVHQAVFNNFEKVSGITIHYVNDNYDEGSFILQKEVKLNILDTPKIIAEKVLKLEHLHFAKTIETLL